MTAKVKVKTNNDDYALFEHERAVVEFEKDGDSPACPNSWKWCAVFDGQLVEGCYEEQSFAASVKDATESITCVIDELTAIRDYLTAFGAFCREPEVSE